MQYAESKEHLEKKPEHTLQTPVEKTTQNDDWSMQYNEYLSEKEAKLKCDNESEDAKPL